jgi:chromosome segregation ATPase
MNELRELESGIERLKRDSHTKGAVIDALEKEKSELLRRSDELSERLRQTSEDYRESFSKLTASVNSQVNQLNMEITGLSNGLKGLSGLEQRLETQEKSHEKSLTRLEKELALVEKTLSDVERMKSELSQQKAFFQKAKLQMDKSLQAGIAYVRKEVEVNRREDARAALEEFKQEIGRITSLEKELNAYRRNQEARLDSTMEELSSVRSSLTELRVLKERTASLEGLGGELDNKVSELASRQKASTAMITSELSKRLDKSMSELKKGLDARRSEDAKSQLREFKQEIERIASMEEGLKAHEKRLDKLGQELSSLQPTSEQVDVLREKVEENLHMNQSLADRTVSIPDFERATKSISRGMEELEGRLFSLEKRLSTDKGRLEKAILEVLNEEKLLEGTQENIRKWFDAKHQELEKRVSSGLDALTTQMGEGAALVDHLRTRSQKLDLMARETPKKLEEHGRQITSLLDAKGGLTASLESLSGDIKTISSRLSSSLERISGLEKALSSTDKSKESRLDRLARDMATYQQELKNLNVLLKEFSDSGKLDVANIRAELGSALKNLTGELDGRVREAAESGLEEIREKTKGLASMRDLESELKVLKSGMSQLTKAGDFISEVSAIKSQLSSLDSRTGDFAGRVARELTEFKKSVDSRFSELSEEQATQFKSEFDFISKSIGSIRDLSSDIKVFKSKLADIERFSRTMLSQQDFAQFRDHIETRISEIEGLSGKSLDRLTQDMEGFKERIESGKLSQKDFTKAMELVETRLQDMGVMAKSSTEELRNDIDSLKKNLSERLNEARGSQLREFKDELNRLSQLEKDTGTYARTHEERIDQLSESLASLQAMPPELGMLREKLESLEKLSGSAVQGKDFSQKLSGINSSLEQLHAGLASLDKRLSSQEAGLDAAIQEALGEDRLLKKSQAGMGKLIDARMAGIDKKMSGSIRELSEAFAQNSEMISQLRGKIAEMNLLHEQSVRNSSALEKLKERMGNLEAASKVTGERASGLDQIMKRLAKLESLSDSALDNSETLQSLDDRQRGLESLLGKLPHVVDKHSESISKILESREFLAENISSLKSEIKSLSNNMFSSQERMTALEKGLSDNERSRETRLDELSKAVESMDTKLESSRNEIKEFREYMIGHVNDTINAYEKRFGELGKEFSGRQTVNLEGSLGELKNLKARVSEIDSLTKKLSEKTVPDSEFVETIKSVSKRIDAIENLYSDIDKKTSVHDAQLDKAVQKALSDDRLLEASQKHVRGWLESRINDIEKRLSGDVASHASQLSDAMREISSIREELAGLKALGEHLDSEAMSKVGESLGGFAKSREKMDKRLDSFTGELKSMNDRLIEEKGRINTLEQKFKSSMDAQQAKLREAINRQKTDMGTEISDEVTKIMKDAEVGELKRKHEFENLLRKFQELHIKTQQNLDAVSSQRKDFTDMETNIKERIDKHNKSVKSKLLKDQDRLENRIIDAENLIMKLNNMISNLKIRLEEEKDVKLDFRRNIIDIKEGLEERMKDNEEMFDSEMNAFKSRADSIANELKVWKDIQKQRKGSLPDTERISRVISGIETEELKRKQEFENLLRKFQELHTKTQQNLDAVSSQRKGLEDRSIEGISEKLQVNREEMKKFKEYVTEYINNLVNTYESRMVTLKKDIDHRLDNIKTNP